MRTRNSDPFHGHIPVGVGDGGVGVLVGGVVVGGVAVGVPPPGGVTVFGPQPIENRCTQGSA